VIRRKVERGTQDLILRRGIAREVLIERRPKRQGELNKRIKSKKICDHYNKSLSYIMWNFYFKLKSIFYPNILIKINFYY